MSKHNGKGSKNGKDPSTKKNKKVIKEPKRTTYTLEQKTHESLKALANMSASFRTEDFQSKEEAEKAYVHLESLQAIFREMQDRDKRKHLSSSHHQ